MERDAQAALAKGAEGFGIRLTPRELDLFRLYLDELLEWNRHIRLTGVRSREGISIELLLDSLIPSPFLPGSGRLLDVGSGAGFPGIPLKIRFPGLDTTLLEAHSKKGSFLKQVIRRLGLTGIRVIRGRIEGKGALLRLEGYDLVTVRALAGLSRSVTWCAPHVRPEGLLVCFLGSKGREVLRESRGVIRDAGLEVERVIPYVLPGREAARCGVVFRKRPEGTKKAREEAPGLV
ncbi:MAG: 16S rRNA (guanine(527)-N(7))-methyltransferase RsmG [Deltaproteobacteria bacterium]|nr:16S rRNA (guanine(527)-N(7))-methyltransferase RsmG [Deltaproteobacteria bacterium]